MSGGADIVIPRTAYAPVVGRASIWSAIWPTAVFIGFGVLFIAKEPIWRAMTLGPVLLLLICMAWGAWRSTRRSVDGEGPSATETDAWNSGQIFLAGVIFLQVIGAGRLGDGWPAYLMLFVYGGAVVAAPALRRYRLVQRLRHRGIVEDERDRAIQADGMRWAKRTLELLIVAGALAYVVLVAHSGVVLEARATVAAVFVAMFVANAIGNWRIAVLHGRDRQ
ncbi:hypothetical protein AO715_13665 [Xanthomonas sp. Mitacek01]|nr:hypothetical protein AO715_13665 [Xanthomonas sp. Mitacek01]